MGMAYRQRSRYSVFRNAALAQLVEQLFCKEKVPGSSPGGGSKNEFFEPPPWEGVRRGWNPVARPDRAQAREVGSCNSPVGEYA